MPLFIMSTESSPIDRLSASWRRRSISRKKQSSQEPDSRPATSNGLLAPSTASTSSTSEESRSTGRSSRRPSLRGIVNRIRSPSNASLASNSSQTMDFDQVENWFQGFRMYNSLVTELSQKPEDRTVDLNKATKSLTKACGGRFLHSLPESAFDFSLLWCPAGPLTRKNDHEPSWSWSAFDGAINFPFDPTTCPDIYKVARSEGEWFRSEIVNLHVGPTSAPYTVRREKCNSLRIKYPPYFHAPRGTEASADSNMLQFTAAAIPAEGFEAEQLHYQDKEIACSRLLNEKDQHCGVIMDYESVISQPSSTGPYEFVLLSRNLRREPAEETKRPKLPIMHPPGTPIWDGERFVWDKEIMDFDDGVYEMGEWKMLNVMLIKWVGDHAERVAIARIHEDEWTQREPKRKDIVLR
ncbi:hypothetical protein ACN47E_000125 [Coniothyrium glycines]